jgi:hypothetical protein
LFTAKLGFDHATRTEKARWERDEKVRLEGLERADRQRWLRDIREVAARFLGASEGLMAASLPSGGGEAGFAQAQIRFNTALGGLRILCPELMLPTERLYLAANSFANYVGEHGPDQSDAFRDAFVEATKAFEAAAQAHLLP